MLAVSDLLVGHLDGTGVVPDHAFKKIRCPSREFAKSNRCISFSSSMRPDRRDVCPLRLMTAHSLEPTVHGVDLRQLRVLDVAGQGGT